MTQRNIGFLGAGYCVPDKVLSNKDLEKLVDTSDEWIVQRTGIRERRMLAEGETPSMIATKAAERAIAHAAIDPNDIGIILYCTFSPDRLCPSSACLVQKALGITAPAVAMDMNAACSGFLYGTAFARAMMRDLGQKYALVIGSEACTRFTDYTDRASCILWGDGAGAAILGDVPEPRGILGMSLGADGRGAEMIHIDGGGAQYPATHRTVDEKLHSIRLEGGEVFKFAVRVFPEAMDAAIANAGMNASDIDLFVMHQANIRIIDAAAKRYGLPPEKVYINVDRFGNTSAASVPIALGEAVETGRLKPGMVVGMVAFGAGLTWAASVVRW